MDILHLHDVHSLDDYADHIHKLNAKWWYDEEGNRKELDKPERFMLMVSEIAEGMEGFRKDLNDDHLPQYPMLWVELADTVIRVLDCAHVYEWAIQHNPAWDTPPIANASLVSSKLYNIVIRIVALSHSEIHRKDIITAGEQAHDVITSCIELAEENGCKDFWRVVYDKLVYNWSRQDHSYAARNAPGGKKF